MREKWRCLHDTTPPLIPQHGPVTAMSSMAEPESARQELENLHNYIVQTGDKTQGFLDWAADHARRLYPDVGQKSYVVPPIFVHQHSSRYDVTAGAEMMQQLQKSSPKGEKAQYFVTHAMDLLSHHLSKPLFIISGLEYDNMLKWVRAHPELTPHVPDDVEKRGDIDIMAIHPDHGLIFIQVKAVGDSPASRTDDSIKMRFLQGGRQLRKDENVFRWVLQDWADSRDCCVTRVVALPNLSRDEVAWPLTDLEPDSEESRDADGVLLMCKDDLPHLGPEVTAAETDVTPLLSWWQRNVSHAYSPLTPKFMKDIVSRYVGLLSAVVVYTGNNVRREVRSKSEAVDVCGMMFRRILLNEQQKKVLTQPCKRRYLSGPPGSGKTVLLTLKARQFVRQGAHVIIINMYRGAKGRAIGHFLAESVAKFSVPASVDTKKGKWKGKLKKKKGEEKDDDSRATTPPRETSFDLSSRVHAVDVDIGENVFDKEAFLDDIRRHLPSDVTSDDVMFIVDEIYVKDYWCHVLDVLDSNFPQCVIWCAGLYSRNPPGFEQEDLFLVLRCPPSVQRVLHAVDWDASRKKNYKLEASDDGLYASGLTPLSVRHGNHPQVRLTECRLCAEQLAFVLDDLLPRKARCCRALTCADVVLLVNIPRELYEPDSRGFLDTTRQDFDTYMAYLDCCPLVARLREKQVPVRTVRELPCYSLYIPDGTAVPAAWVYTYQGLETKVVIYLPGDTPCRPDPRPQEIPAPGLCSDPRPSPKTFTPVTEGVLRNSVCGRTSASRKEPVLPPAQDSDCKGRASQDIISESNSHVCNHRKLAKLPSSAADSNFDGISAESSAKNAKNAIFSLRCNSDNVDINRQSHDSACKMHGREGMKSECLEIPEADSNRVCCPASNLKMSDFWWKVSDIERLSNWDKANLFVAGSRCLSQLIMFIP